MYMSNVNELNISNWTVFFSKLHWNSTCLWSVNPMPVRMLSYNNMNSYCMLLMFCKKLDWDTLFTSHMWKFVTEPCDDKNQTTIANIRFMVFPYEECYKKGFELKRIKWDTNHTSMNDCSCKWNLIGQIVSPSLQVGSLTASVLSTPVCCQLIQGMRARTHLIVSRKTDQKSKTMDACFLFNLLQPISVILVKPESTNGKVTTNDSSHIEILK